MTIALDSVTVAFFGTTIGSVLYGVFFVLAVLSTVLHIKREARSYPKGARSRIFRSIIRNPMIMAGLALIGTVTTHWILDLILSAQGFLEIDSKAERSTLFTDLGEPRYVAGTWAFVASMSIVDGMIVYRLWLVWNRSILVSIFPVLTSMGLFVSGIGTALQMTHIPPGETPFASSLRHWVVADFVLNLLTNAYSTGLISWRIYSMNSMVGNIARERKLNWNPIGILVILIESAALLSGWMVLEMITFALKTPLQSFMLNTLGTVSGISFMLINVRVALGWSQIDPTSTMSTSTPIFAPRSQMQAQIHIATTVDIRDDEYELDNTHRKV
ncbi:hypothetical protein C8J56DRAFT_971489 [Mycena floridula]|nr:hypothetical protein C8J56DRAFT_974810 [Mycena floridula]KAJ7577294.1 hypothetical protein C8J56DRAFT_971489 [Mycena floridula]